MKLPLNFLLLILILTNTGYSQTDSTLLVPKKDPTKVWNKGGVGGVQFVQAAYSNWSAGGENSLAVTGLLNLYANYEKKKATWDNYLDVAYGFIRTAQFGIRKNDDRMEINSSFGYREKQTNWYYTVLVNGLSQFDRGYNFPDDSTRISNFAAPAFVKVAMGIEHKPNKNLRLLIAPLTGKSTIVTDTMVNEIDYGLDEGKRWRNEYGAYLKFYYRKEIFKNIIFTNKTDLFSNYAEDPQNIDITTQIQLTFNVNKYMSAGLTLDMIYDDNIAVAVFDEVNGVREQIGEGPRMQLKEVITLRLAAKF